jgi:hypothetical protein
MYNFLIRKHEGKGIIWKTWNKFDNINKYFKDIQWEGVDWMHLTQDKDHWFVLIIVWLLQRTGNLTTIFSSILLHGVFRLVSQSVSWLVVRKLLFSWFLFSFSFFKGL